MIEHRRSVEARRGPHVVVAFLDGPTESAKLRRQHADDVVQVGVEPNASVENAGIGAELAPPHRVADDHFACEARRSIVGRKLSAQLRRDAQQCEVVWRDADQAHPRRRGRPREIVFIEPRGRDVLEDARPLEVEPLRLRHADVVRSDAFEIVLDAHQLFGVRIGQRSQQRRVDDAENRGRCTDAERERENSDRGEAGRLAEHAHGVPNVLNGVIEPEPPARLVEPFARQRHVSEVAMRSGARRVVVEALFAQPGDVLVEVTVDLRREIVERASPSEHRVPLWVDI